MTPDAPQVVGTYKKCAWARGRRIRVAALVGAVAVGGAAGAGCEGAPARSKPWRHAADAGAVGVSAAAAPILAGEEARLRAMAARGDTLTVWLDSDPRSLDPRVGPTVWTMRITSDTVFESLVRYRPGESEAQPGGYEPRLARSWRVGTDGREIVFELQPDVRFHDGRALTAGDVQRSIEAARRAAGSHDPAAAGRVGPLGADLADVTGIDVVGPRAVRVRLARANAHVLRALAEVPIVAAARASGAGGAGGGGAGGGGAGSGAAGSGAAAGAGAGASGAVGAAGSATAVGSAGAPGSPVAPGSAPTSAAAPGSPPSVSPAVPGVPAVKAGSSPPSSSSSSSSSSGPGSPPTAAWVAEVVGTGPYRIRSWRDGTVELERFDGYWGARPAVDHIAFRYEPDAAAALRRARSGEIDVVPALIREHRGEQGRGPGTTAALSPLRLRPPVLRYLSLNARRPPFDDARVRCALGRLLDRAALVRAGKQFSRAAGGPIWPGGPGDGPAMEAPPFDRAGASALLDQAGWRDEDGDGLRAREGRRLLLTVLVSDRADPERDLVLEQLRAAGFVLDARVGSTAVLDNRLRDGRFDVAFVEWSALSGADLTPVLGTGGALNFGGFTDPRVDEALAALRQAWQPAARWDGMRRLGALLAETCPVVPLVAPDPHGLISRRVRAAPVSGGWLTLRGAVLAPSDEAR